MFFHFNKFLKVIIFIIPVFFFISKINAQNTCSLTVTPTSGTTNGPFILRGDCTNSYGQYSVSINYEGSPNHGFASRLIRPDADGKFEIHLENFVEPEDVKLMQDLIRNGSPILTVRLMDFGNQFAEVGTATFTVTNYQPPQCGQYTILQSNCPSNCLSQIIPGDENNASCGPIHTPTPLPPPIACNFIPQDVPPTIQFNPTTNNYTVSGNINFNNIPSYVSSLTVTTNLGGTGRVITNGDQNFNTYYSFDINASPNDVVQAFVTAPGCEFFCSWICSSATVPISLTIPTGIPGVTPVPSEPLPTYLTPAPSQELSPTPDPGQTFKVTTCYTVEESVPGTGIFDGGEKGIQTALGCIPTSISGISKFFFRIALGMGGGIAFLLIIWGGIRMMLSTGDPKKLQESREILTSAIVGLIIIIFSIFILRVVGVNILAIPGFG